MKNLLLFLVFFILGFLGYTGFHMWQASFQQSQIVSQVQKQEEKFDVAIPPKESKIGTIVSMSGDVKWESRVATDAASIISPVPIKQGERLATGDQGNVKVDFAETASISISPKSDASFVQTLPSDFVVNQTKGEVWYQKTGQTALSIRSLHLLTRVASGSADISLNEKNPQVTLVVNGEAIAAFNDLKNESNLLNLISGKTYVFNDEQRTLVEQE